MNSLLMSLRYLLLGFDDPRNRAQHGIRIQRDFSRCHPDERIEDFGQELVVEEVPRS